MTEFQRNESGLVVPREKPSTPPRRDYGPHELQDPELRRVAEEGLLKLWDAMLLTQGSRGLLSSPYSPLYEAAYEMIGRLLLGDDCPRKEQWT